MNKKNLKKGAIIFVIALCITAVYTFIKIEIHKGKIETTCFNALAERLDKGVLPAVVVQENFEKLQMLKVVLILLFLIFSMSIPNAGKTLSRILSASPKAIILVILR